MTLSPSHNLRYYRTAAVRLREALEWNHFDVGFQEGLGGRPPGRIVPVVDANIVSLFMDPTEKLNLVDPFGLQRSPPRGQVKLLTFARITAEFMFLSSPVRIGDEAGQLWREPPLLAPGHSDEITGILSSIEMQSRHIFRQAQDSSEAAAREEAGTEVEQRVDELAQILAARQRGDTTLLGSNPLRKGVADLVGALDSLFARLAGSHTLDLLLQVIRWMRLIQEGKVRPLAVHLLADQELLAPPTAEVNFWADRLEPEKISAMRERGRAGSNEDARKLAENDAAALIQVNMLNRRSRDQQGDASPTRFVLISGDDALHRIYADHFWSSPRRGDLNEPQQEYVLRRPIQYVPVLNLRDIPNGYRSRGLFDEIAGLLDTITSFVQDRTCGAFALEYDRRRAAERSSNIEADKVERLLQLWEQAIQASCASCAALAVQNYGLQDLNQRLDALATQESKVPALIQLHRDIFSDIDTIHLQLIVPGLVSVAAQAVQRQRDFSNVSGTRIPLLVRDHFEKITRGEPIEDFIQTLSGRRNVLVERLFRMERNRHRLYFLAGVVAAAANDFVVSARFLERASTFAKEESDRTTSREIQIAAERRDIDYLRAVVGRMLMRTMHDYDRLVRQHELLSRRSSTSSFEAVRTLSEHASLHLTQYFNLLFIINGGRENVGARAAAVELAHRDLQAASDTLPTMRRSAAAEPYLLRRLEEQIHTNLICCAVIESGFFEETGQLGALSSRILVSLDLLARDAVGTDHIVDLWSHVGRWVLGDASARPQLAEAVLNYCKPIITNLKKLKESNRPPADLPVFEYVVCNARRAAGG